MPKGYRAYFPEQDFLLPPSLGQWLPERHLCDWAAFAQWSAVLGYELCVSAANDPKRTGIVSIG